MTGNETVVLNILFECLCHGNQGDLGMTHTCVLMTGHQTTTHYPVPFFHVQNHVK